MKQIRTYLLLSLVLLTKINLRAQDSHLSQYYAAPATINPAATGYYDGDYMFSANFRQQWMGIGYPYFTGMVSFDTKIMQLKMQKDIFAVGLLASYDKSLNGGLKNTEVLASVAYHKSLDEQGDNKLGLGFQFAYSAKTINSDYLNFATQFNGSGFDTNLPSYEQKGTMDHGYFDLNAGLIYTLKKEKLEGYLGVSAFHLTNPDLSFLKGNKYRLPLRYAANAGSKIFLNENRDELNINGLFMYQAGATEENFGIIYGKHASETVIVYGGIWYRINDAFIPYVGIHANGFQLGVSYDVNNSGLKDYKAKNGSFEVALNIQGKRPTNPYTNYKGGRIF